LDGADGESEEENKVQILKHTRVLFLPLQKQRKGMKKKFQRE